MTYAGFSNQETFNASVAIDDDDVMYEKVEDAVEMSLDEGLDLANEIKEIVAHRFDLIGSGYGRHVLMDLVRMAQFIGSPWRINWNELAEHYRERAK